MKKVILYVFASFLGGLIALNLFNGKEEATPVVFQSASIQQEADAPVQFKTVQQGMNNRYARAASQGGLDFTGAAERATPAVVHIKTKSTRQPVNNYNYNNPFGDLFGDDLFREFFDQRGGGNPYGGGAPRGGATGSGVIISSDGYIVTNNHVIEGGDMIEVVLENNRSYEATVVGTDPSTDIALIKIEERGLPYLEFENSDAVKVGQWVLAVGNPFNLASTVTAGIVSAKARNINILRDKAAIESFIQTDAAVNPGNSGGALVNLNGDLIGINTAIATPTGTFAGYSFAVPANLVRKVVEDLKKHGVVQRAYLGVNINDLNSELANELGIDETEGVYIAGVMEGSGAEDAGLQNGDVIVSVENRNVKSAPELQEAVAAFRPGDRIDVEFIRNNRKQRSTVLLKNVAMNTQRVTAETSDVSYNNVLGAELSPVSRVLKDKLGLESGVQISNLSRGRLTESTDIKNGFIITKIDQRQVNSLTEINQILDSKRGQGVMIEGVYPDDPSTYYYAFGL